MSNVYGITLKNEGKIYYFNGEDLEIEKMTYVVVETEKGIQYGKVMYKAEDEKVNIPVEDMKKVVRVATDKDRDNYLKNLAEAEKCLKEAREVVEELGLEMNLLDANYTLDKKQLLFNFIADERVDFRELAKRLAGMYKTRIELRQIGARDKARNICGIGQCGRPLCCSTFLNHIDSVTMNMAKNQNIALNPSKINGQCGRLLCCLTYEDEEYARCQKGMPSVGQTVKTDDGSGKVVSVDILKRKYKVDIDGNIKEIELGDVKGSK
jgi:cell fate regulator YaaT (PSP1 superfamily)